MCDYCEVDAASCEDEKESIADAEARIDAQFPGEWDDGEQGDAW
jgi:hypothetical protein